MRADYINNPSNGGGVLGSNAKTVADDTGLSSYSSTLDAVNGFGIASDSTGSTGVNRYALSVGFNYLITPNHTANSGAWNTGTWYKMELRADGANGLVFYDASSGGYKRDSLTLLSSLVFAF